MNKKVIIFMDRDGTVNKDENYYLGSSPNWKEQVSFLPGVIEGLKLSMTIPNSHRFIVSNQSGVALEKFPLMTEQRMKEVNTYVVEQLENQGIKIDGYFACPFVDKTYLERATAKGNKIDPKYYLEDSPCFKPNPGMINQGIKSLNLQEGEYIAFMIGDRYSDMKLAENAGATGILVESYKTIELKETDKTRQMGFYVATDFLDAIKHIIKELT